MGTTTLKKISLATAGTTAIGLTMLAGVTSSAEAAVTLTKLLLTRLLKD